MKFLGFNFTKVSAEKYKSRTEKLKANTKIDVSEIKEPQTDLFKTKDTLLDIKFVYNINYSEDFANLEFKGDIMVSVDSKTGKEVLKGWKNNNIPEEFKRKIFNLIMKKSNVKAVELEDELNIPLHVPMPKIGKPKQEE